MSAKEVTNAVKPVFNAGDDAVSVGIEDIAPKDWAEKVYRSDILDKADTLYKKPGYNPFK